MLSDAQSDTDRVVNAHVRAREELRQRMLDAFESEQQMPVADLSTVPRLRSNRNDQFEPFPLLDLQQAYWVGRQSNSQAAGTACHGYLELDVPELDTARFEQALNQLIERHPMLRAVIDPDGMQRVLRVVPPYRPLVVNALDDAAAVDAIRVEMSHQVLPTDQWPLFDIRIAQVARAVSRVHISFDILIADAMSFQILASELVGLYLNPALSLPPIDVTFRDYVLHATGEEGRASRTDAENYWRAAIDALPAAPDLPLRCPVDTIAAPEFKRLEAKIDGQQWLSLQRLARSAGVGTASALLVSFADTIGLWASEPEFTLNLTIFDRPPLHPHIDRVVGAFTNTTLLAINLGEHSTVRARTAAVQQQLWRNLENREFTGVALLREMSRMRRADLAMPVVFTHIRTPDGRDFRDDLSRVGTVQYAISQTPQVLLDCQVVETAASVSVIWDVLAAAFDEAMLGEMFETFIDALRSLANPDTWDAPYAATTPHAVPSLRAAHETASWFPLAPLHELVLAAAAKAPEATAIVDTASKRSVTYGELTRSALTVTADLLKSHQDTTGPLVGVIGSRSWTAIAAVVGVCAAGLAYLPLDPALPPERLSAMATAAGISTLVVGPGQPRPSWFDGIVVTVDPNPSEPDTVARPTVALADLAYVIFTSGSTGVPKGVRITHGAAAATLLDINQRFQVDSDDRVLGISSLGFDLSVWDIFGVLSAGATVVLPENADAARDPVAWLAYIAEHGVTLWNSVPALMSLLIELAQLRGLELPTLRLAMLSGDWIPIDLPEQVRLAAPNARVISLGGATEAAIWSVMHDTAEPSPGWSTVPYGRPLTNQRTYVLDGIGRERPFDVPGELYIGGSGVADGYWHSTALTDRAFPLDPHRGRLYRTGDFVRFRRTGDLEILFRIDGQVKIRGYRVELGDLDAALSRLPLVKAGVSQVIGDREHERHLVSYVVPTDPDLTAEDLRHGLRQLVPEYLLPSRVIFVPEIPLSQNGKVDQQQLRNLLSSPPGSPGPKTDNTSESLPTRLARSPLGAHLLNWVRLRLGEPSIDVDTDLVLFGMDSVHLVKLLNEAERKFGLRPSHVELMRSPSVLNFQRLLEVELVRRFDEADHHETGQPVGVSNDSDVQTSGFDEGAV